MLTATIPVTADSAVHPHTSGIRGVKWRTSVEAAAEKFAQSNVSAPLVAAPITVDFKPDFMKKNYRALTFTERVSIFFRCKGHTFSWPHTDQEVPLQVAYPWTPYKNLAVGAKPDKVSFDSHQICTCCGVQRFYDSRTCTPGEYFVRTDAGSSAHRQQRVA